MNPLASPSHLIESPSVRDGLGEQLELDLRACECPSRPALMPAVGGIVIQQSGMLLNLFVDPPRPALTVQTASRDRYGVYPLPTLLDRHLDEALWRPGASITPIDRAPSLRLVKRT